MAKYLRMWLLFAALAACLALSACGGGKKEKDRKRDSAEENREETAERDDASEKGKGGVLDSLLGKDADSEGGREEEAGDPALRAYAQVVREKEAEYGEGSLKNTGISWIDGVGFLHLTDFDGDGTEELILAHGSRFEQTLEVYAADGDKARQIYSGGALMYGMDTPLVELWDGPAGKKYLLVNKGDYFDGKVSFLGYDGQDMTEAAESSLADPGAGTSYARAERFALNFDGGDEAKTKALEEEAESRLADVRAVLGISGISGTSGTSGGLFAAGGGQEGDSIFDGQGQVVIDDDELTLRVHGKTVVRFKDMDRAAYCVTAENHTPYLLELSGAHLRDDFVYEHGTVDGATIIGIYFAEKTDPEPEKYDITEAMTFPGIPAGATMQLYMAPECAGYGIKTPEHLVNVTANINTSHGSGNTFEYRNYVLSLDQGGTAPALPDGYEDYQCRYFSFTIPKAWEYAVIGETDDVGQYNISLPPKYNDHAMSSIIIRYDDFFSAAESVKSIEEFYLTDNRDGNYTVNTFEREIDGKQLPAVEVFGKISDSRFHFYFLDMPDGKTVTIQTSVELPFLEELDGEYEKFLDSIRW